MNPTKKTFICSLFLFIILFNLNACQNKPNKNETPNPKPKTTQDIIKPKSNYTYSNLQKQINKLQKNYDQLTISTIGQSIAGRQLHLLKLGTGEQKIAVVGGVHGRENMTSLLLLKLIEDYVQQTKKNNKIKNYDLNKILDHVTFYFIPMLNPDGIEIAINGLTNLENKVNSQKFYQRANERNTDFKHWKANARGVDLNKQFPADWKKIESEDKAHFAHYKGPTPESEPESKALADLTRQEDFATIIAFHSSGQVIYWYYNQTGQQYKRDQQLANKLSTQNNYQLVSPEESDIPAAGYKDWFITKFNRPGFTIEIGEKDKDKPLPAHNLDDYFNKNRTVLLELARNL